ncbi:integrase [Edwardsiella piscicida]|nr:hypothetical protein BXA22_15125 [Edwardsiella piscicida]GAJ64405.1 integrase [Edwardsiella piscicida]GBK56920.1 integrase [Edwardsiella piscicida]
MRRTETRYRNGAPSLLRAGLYVRAPPNVTAPRLGHADAQRMYKAEGKWMSDKNAAQLAILNQCLITEAH